MVEVIIGSLEGLECRLRLLIFSFIIDFTAID